jgi:hypothetical protein
VNKTVFVQLLRERMGVAIEIPRQRKPNSAIDVVLLDFFLGFHGIRRLDDDPRIVCYVGTNVSEERTASIFKESCYLLAIIAYHEPSICVFWYRWVH